MLRNVLAIQSNGNSVEAEAFIQKYTTWKPELHDGLAERLRDSAKYRYRMVKYKALQ